MLPYMAPQIATLNGHYNIVVPNIGRFYWVKAKIGYPWDVDQFDRSFIYQSITEVDWNNPSTYKKFHVAMPWMPRCVNVQATGKRSTILLTPEQTTFDIHIDCTNFTTHNLGYVINEMWYQPPNLVLVYRYNCDSKYGLCGSKETFAMQTGLGMVQWTFYEFQNGTWVQKNQTTHSTISMNTVKPIHPCWTD